MALPDSRKAAGEAGICGLGRDISHLRKTSPAGPPVDPGLFVDANDLPVCLAAKLDFAGPSVETLDAY